MLAQPIDQEDRWHHYADEPDHEPSERVDALVEAGQLPLPNDTGSQRPKVGLSTGMNDHRGRGSAFYV